jgi:hypothetical protein
MPRLIDSDQQAAVRDALGGENVRRRVITVWDAVNDRRAARRSGGSDPPGRASDKGSETRGLLVVLKLEAREGIVTVFEKS